MQGMLIVEDAVICFANPAGARIFGYASPDDLIGQKLDLLIIQACPTTDHYVRIIFQDTGHGIPAQDLTRVFEPFYTTKGDKGSGLGLAVCQQIIHGHGGTISLHSTPGEGTTVTIGLAQADTVSGHKEVCRCRRFFSATGIGFATYQNQRLRLV